MDRPHEQLYEQHYKTVIKQLADGSVVPFFGAGVNLCGHNDTPWSLNQNIRLPLGGELAEYLATRFSYPMPPPRSPEPAAESPVEPPEAPDLTRVSQYASTMLGPGNLYDVLHGLFDRTYPPTPLHHFFAALPAALRRKKYLNSTDFWRQRIVVVTTNYDDLMEQAFEAAGEDFHVIFYKTEKVALEGRDTGVFMHRLPDGKQKLITREEANKYGGMDKDRHPVILKVHGAVDRSQPDPDASAPIPRDDSFVITEDDYIDYLTLADIKELLPMKLVTQLIWSNFLFLGYSLRDWNMRAFLRRIWRAQNTRPYNSWAVMLNLPEFDQEYWRSHKVTPVYRDLGEYVGNLERHLDELEVNPRG